MKEGQDMKKIEVSNLTKEFKSYRSREGLRGAFRDLLSREYQTMRAVNEISFEVGQGEMVGYIGENGAGKSTTIKMLTGILRANLGSFKSEWNGSAQATGRVRSYDWSCIRTAKSIVVGYSRSGIVSIIKKGLPSV